MIEYNLIEINNFGNIDTILERKDGEIVSYIPMDESNSDYQRYLRHLAGKDENGL